MHVVVLSHRHPLPTTRGDSRRVLGLVTALAAHAQVTLVTFGQGPPIPGVACRYAAVDRTPLGLLRAAGSHRGAPLRVRAYLDHAMQELVAGIIDRERPEVVHASMVHMAAYLPGPGAAHRHLDLIDPLSVTLSTTAATASGAQAAFLRVQARSFRRYERKVAAAADSTSLVSAADLESAPHLAGAAIIPNGVDAAEFPFQAPTDRPPALLFFGNLTYPPNITAAQLVAIQVLPAVRRRRPEVTLRIAGADVSQEVAALGELPGVEIVGRVPSIADELHRVAAAALPMSSGSGMKNKVLEAFSAGTPVVANALGIQGVDGALPGTHHLQGESPEEMASAVVQLLDEPQLAGRLAGASHALVDERYRWEARAAALLELYRGGQAPTDASTPAKKPE